MGTILSQFWGRRITPHDPNSSPISSGQSKTPPVLSTPMAGASGSGPTKDVAPPKQLNDGVFEFYNPGDDCDAEIIFFHGLQVEGDYREACWKTWLSTDGTVIWPRDWLRLQCPKSRTLSVSYNASAELIEGAGSIDEYAWGENMVGDIIHTAECGQEPGRPVFLVGHCLGGIMIKQFIKMAIDLKNRKQGKPAAERIDKFLQNFRGAFFYSTPNGGSPEIEKWAKRLQDPSPLLKLLKVLSTTTRRLNEEFREHRDNLKVRTYAVTETNPTTSYGFNAQVVPEASARDDVDDFYSYGGSDHFSVCRARSKDDFTVIGKLVHFTQEIINHEKEANLNQRFEALKSATGQASRHPLARAELRH